MYKVVESGNHTDNHPPVPKRCRTWTQKENQALLEFLTIHPKAKAKVMLAEIQRQPIFGNTGISKSELDAWLRKNRPPNDLHRTATLEDVRTIIAKYKTPYSVIDRLGDTENIVPPIPGCPHLLTGEDVRTIAKDSKPRTTTDGTQFAFCIPGTSKALMSRIMKSREQIYLRLEKITDTEGAVFEEIKSKGILLSDGVWSLVQGGVACVLRVSSVTRNGKNRRIGLVLASGETGWVVHCTHAAYHRLAVRLFGIDPEVPYGSWHLIDGGTGLTNGLKRFLDQPILVVSGTHTQIAYESMSGKTHFSVGILNPILKNDRGRKQPKFLCYFISLLQAMVPLYIEWAVNVMLLVQSNQEKPDTLRFVLAETLVKMRDSNHVIDITSTLYAKIEGEFPKFVQQDAEEVWTFIWNSLTDDKDFCQITEIELQTHIKCQDCEYVQSPAMTPSPVLRVHWKTAEPQLSLLLEDYGRQNEEIDYKCQNQPQCQGNVEKRKANKNCTTNLVEGRKCTQVVLLPSSVVVNLIRYKSTPLGEAVKRNEPITYGLGEEFSVYSSTSTSGAVNIHRHLFSVLCHKNSGKTTKTGHCYSYVKNAHDGLWFMYNDEIATQVDEGVVLKDRKMHICSSMLNVK